MPWATSILEQPPLPFNENPTGASLFYFTCTCGSIGPGRHARDAAELDRQAHDAWHYAYRTR